uniref:Uncharacterized protein n=1 Tax=Anguilla anguilla TaxID=7936 RepID=A0A0E9R9Y9_ANGAN
MWKFEEQFIDLGQLLQLSCRAYKTVFLFFINVIYTLIYMNNETSPCNLHSFQSVINLQ